MQGVWVVVAAVLCFGEVRGAYNPCLSPYPDDNFMMGTFPPNFFWATATAAYQVEGGWNASGKGVNIWDSFCHLNPSPIAYGQSGDVACDSYHKWQTDIQLMKNMGLKYYRMSISWARLYPTGIVAEGMNPDGYRYYRNYFLALKQAGISPLVTLYHWDLPQHLQDMGGFMNNDFSDWFNDYATGCFSLFGDLVKYWITFNEPWVVSVLGYGYGSFAPAVSTCLGTCPYIVTHNIIKGHAKAYRTYDAKFRSKQKGMVGMTMNCDYKIPTDQKPENIAAADRAMQWQLGWFAHPIYSKQGDYPQVMKDIIANRSAAEGFPTSRLPAFTAAEKKYIQGAFDFFGINMYTTQVVYNAPNPPSNIRWDSDSMSGYYQCGNWPNSGSDWLKYVPWGARGLLNWIKKEYNNPLTIITENGWSDKNGSTSDSWRIHYYNNYINNVLKAIKTDGCNVMGYTAWSLMDNFEWRSGYTQKFGIHYVNFSDPARPRVPKDSAKWFAKLVANNGFTASTTAATPPPPTSTMPPTTSTAPPTSPPTTKMSTTMRPTNCSCGALSRIIYSYPGSQQLTSPNYPNNYCSNGNCRWTLVVPSTRRVGLAFNDFQTELGFDFLTVIDTNGNILEKCSGNSCNNTRSSGSRLTVQFNSDANTNSRGFSATFSAV